MKIILDCFGGDNCPSAAVEGGLCALAENDELSITLCGDTAKIKVELKGRDYDASRVEFIDAPDVITNEDRPFTAIRRKKASSMIVGLTSLRDGEGDGFVSGGNTGALLSGASVYLKQIEGITRASLCPVAPTLDDARHTLIADGGANVDCRPAMLREFAIMGDVYMREMFGIDRPTVGLLNNGVEEGKGNALTKETYALLKDTDINFVGNIEARDFLTGKVDVIVTDGFAGNMAIKASEGMAYIVMELIKRGIVAGGLKAKLGYLMIKGALRGVKAKISSDEVGGGAFLGVNGVVVKTHGASNANAYKNAVLKAAQMVKTDVVGKLRSGLAAKIVEDSETDK